MGSKIKGFRSDEKGHVSDGKNREIRRISSRPREGWILFFNRIFYKYH